MIRSWSVSEIVLPNTALQRALRDKATQPR